MKIRAFTSVVSLISIHMKKSLEFNIFGITQTSAATSHISWKDGDVRVVSEYVNERHNEQKAKL